jgi:hypothetical protein
MKRFIILLIFAIPYLSGKSQNYQKISTWEEYLNRFRVTGMLRPPHNPISGADSGSFYYRKSDSAYRYWSGNAYRNIVGARQINDSTLVVGDDTITIRGTGGGGGASSGYGWINSSGVGKVDTNTIDNRYFNVVNLRQFGAVPNGPDATAAIQAAINYVHARGGGTIVVPGHLFVSGAVQEFVNGRECRCQLYLPYSSSDSARVIRFVAENPVDMEVIGIDGMAVSEYGAIIESTLTGQADSTFILGALKGPGSGTYTKMNHTTPIFDGVCFRTNLSSGAHGQGGLNLKYASKVLGPYLKVDINVPIFNMPAVDTVGSIGILLPERGNHAVIELGLVRIVGYSLGMDIQEHTVIQDFQPLACNVGAIYEGGDHSSSIQTFEGELNKINLKVAAAGDLWISNFNSEHYTTSDKWFQWVSDIHYEAAANAGITIGTYSAANSGSGTRQYSPTTNKAGFVNCLNCKFGSTDRSLIHSTKLGEFNDAPGKGVLEINDTTAVANARRFALYNFGGLIGGSYLNDAGTVEGRVFAFTQDALNPARVNFETNGFNIGGAGTISNAGAQKLNIYGDMSVTAGIKLTGTPTSSSDVNVINLHNDASTMALLGGPGANTDASNGPFFNMRGNNYSAIAGQRGVTFIGAGNPSTPTGLEGSILFYTGATSERMRINPAGNVLIGTGTDNSSGAKLQVNGDATVADEAYDATAWNGSNEVPTKNALRDKIESLGSASGIDAVLAAGNTITTNRNIEIGINNFNFTGNGGTDLFSVGPSETYGYADHFFGKRVYFETLGGVLDTNVPTVTNEATYRLSMNSSTGQVLKTVEPKVYTALLTATAGNAPAAAILGTNTVGTIVWTRNSTGNYTGTLSGAFTSNKTWSVVQRGDMGGNFVNGWMSSGSTSTVTLIVQDNAGAAVDAFTNLSIEIRVYP